MNERLLKKALYLFLVIIFLACSKKKNVKQNLVSLDSKDYENLDVFIKDKSVIGLGEYTHGDGELFELKTEIIRHLHKKLGFEAVLMESDFLATDQTLTALSSRSIKDAANIGIQSTWADSKEFSSFLKYLQDTAKMGDTLFFHGFDSQMTGVEAISIHETQAQLIKKDLTSDEFSNIVKSLKIINSRNVANIDLDSLKLFEESIAKIDKVKIQHSEKSLQWLKNVEGNLRQLILEKQAPKLTSENLDRISEILSHPNYIRSGSIRDSLMFENIEYYLRRYNRLIIWAANKHLQNKSENRIWMGSLLKQSLKDKYYSILVLYDHGHWSYPTGKPSGVIPKAEQGTLAFEISNSTNSEVAYLDLKTTEIPKMQVRTNNWMTTDSILVDDYGDAILYIRNATGSTLLEDLKDEATSPNDGNK